MNVEKGSFRKKIMQALTDMSKNDERKKKKLPSDLYTSNWFAIGLLLVGVVLAIINVAGYLVNPVLFSSFSWLVFSFIFIIAAYMLYNIRRIINEKNKVVQKHRENV